MKKSLFKALIITCIMLLNVCLANNTISSVIISKNNAYSYNLQINSLEPVKYKKGIEDNNTIYFDIENANISDNLQTKYDNTPNIKSIAVKKLNNKVRIYIEGPNFKNNTINFQNGYEVSYKNNLFINSFNEMTAGIIILLLTIVGIVLAQIKDKFTSHFNKKIYQNSFHANYKNNILKIPEKLNIQKPINKNITINDYQRRKNPYMAQVITNNSQPKQQSTLKKAKTI